MIFGHGEENLDYVVSWRKQMTNYYNADCYQMNETVHET